MFFPHYEMPSTSKMFWNDQQCGNKNWFVCQNVTDSSETRNPSWPSHVALGPSLPYYQLQSPLYPLPYPNLVDVEIVFTAPVQTTIVVEFEDFDRENETSCSYDKVVIKEQVCV